MDAYHHQYAVKAARPAAARVRRNTMRESLTQPRARSASPASKSCYKGLHTMKIRVFLLAIALAAFGWVRVPATTSLMPIDEIKPGMIGVGRTIFEGSEMKDFKVHILGVLKNVQAPKRNLILAKLEGGPLAETGVIAGMSGSPVYIDGRLIGAVSYSIGAFPKEPIAGITPIAEMIEATSETCRATRGRSAPVIRSASRSSGATGRWARPAP